MFGEEEKKHIDEVMATGIIMRYGFDGPRKGIYKSLELERKICETFGCAHAQLTSSGTAALTTAMAALGIGQGDEVIIPSFTFVASFEAVLSVGAIPVLVDIDETLTLSPAAVLAAITPKTKAVMPVHMCGSMADMDALLSICQEKGLLLIEDACQSIGGTYHGKKLGTIGHAGTFSFDFVKIITCGEGGVVMTNDKDVFEKCDGFTDHGHDHKGIDRGADLHPFLGYNFRISELHAAIGLGQIGKLDKILAIQRHNQGVLKSYLAQVPGLKFREVPDEAGDSCSFLSWSLPDAAQTQAAIGGLKTDGLMAGSFYWYDNNWHYVRKWQHLHQAIALYALSPEQNDALRNIEGVDFSISDAIMSRYVSTLINLTWTEGQLHEKGAKMLASIQKALGN